MRALLIATALLAFAAAAPAQDNKELKVAIDPTYEPFTFKTPDGKPTGFDVDIANELTILHPWNASTTSCLARASATRPH